MLQKRYSQFQRRMARNYLNMSSEAPSSESATRPEATRLANEEATRRRPVLETVFTDASTKQVQSSKQIGKAQSQQNFSIFADHSIAPHDNGYGYGDRMVDDNSAWKHLASEKDRTKENRCESIA